MILRCSLAFRNMSDNKRIAKNTLFLYVRMLFVMGVSLYSARVVLDKLGVDDYSLYNVVGGIVGMLSFLNGTLSIGTSRFLTYELGRKEKNKLSLTFNTTFYAHLALGILFILLLETAGVWYICNKLVVDASRFDAAMIVFQISIIASLISMIQVPYTSLILAHEEMGVYAYVGIFEAVAKLGVIYALVVSETDKLILYAVLIAIVQLLVTMCFWAYCHRHYIESQLNLLYDNSIMKSLLSFSGWNVLANLSETLKLQGYIILLNLFFQPFVVAAQTIGNQVAGAMMQFINNFRNAINPQIIKLYAAGEYEESKRLTMSTTVLVFDLVLLLGLPTIIVMDTIMNIWLVEVPPYAVIFTQYIIVQRILSTFDASFYIPMMAEGKIKTNSILASFSGPGLFLLLYVIYKVGGDVMWMQYTGIIAQVLFGFLIKPYLLVHDEQGYSYSDFVPCFFSCMKVTVLAVGLSYLFYCVVGNTNIYSTISLFLLSVLSVMVSSYIFMSSEMKSKMMEMVKNTIVVHIRDFVSRK